MVRLSDVLDFFVNLGLFCDCWIVLRFVFGALCLLLFVSLFCFTCLLLQFSFCLFLCDVWILTVPLHQHVCYMGHCGSILGVDAYILWCRSPRLSGTRKTPCTGIFPEKTIFLIRKWPTSHCWANPLRNSESVRHLSTFISILYMSFAFVSFLFSILRCMLR